MTEKYNPTAFVTKISDSGSLLEIDLLEPGQLCIYTEKEPQSVPYQHTYENNILIINADEASAVIKL
jgi:hypothetical protein